MTGELASLGSALMWGSSTIIMANLARRVHPLLINGLQASVGFLFLGILLVLVAVFANVGHLSVVAGFSLAGAAILNIAIGNTSYINSLSAIGAARGMPITSALYPLLTLVLAALLLGEELTLGMALGAALIIVGIVLIVRASHRRQNPHAVGVATLTRGVALACFASVAWAGGAIWLRTIMDDGGINPVTANLVRMAASALTLWLLILTAGRTSPAAITRQSVTTLGLVAVSGIAGNGLSSLLFTVAIKEAGAAKTAVLSSTAPLFVLPMAVLFLAERPGLGVMAGTALTVAGVFLVV